MPPGTHPDSYKAIRAWGLLLELSPYTIRQRQQKALSDGADTTATHYNKVWKRWVLISDLPTSLRREVESRLDTPEVEF